MSELSEIREMVHELKSIVKEHIGKTEVYREERDKQIDSHHKTLYNTDTGLVYCVDRLREIAKLNENHKVLIVTLFGVPIVGLIAESIWKIFNK